jgi:hypothetical protein
MKRCVSLYSVDSAYTVFNEEFLSVNLTEAYFFKQLLSFLIISIVADKAEHIVSLTKNTQSIVYLMSKHPSCFEVNILSFKATYR